MSHYTKERNIITFYLNGVNGVYKFDLNTATFYGLKGRPVLNVPKRKEICNILLPPTKYISQLSHLERQLYSMFVSSSYSPSFSCWIERLKCAERLDAIGFKDAIYDYPYINKHFTNFCKYIREVLKGADSFSQREFIKWNEFECAKKELGNMVEYLTPTMYQDMTNTLPNLSREEWAVVIYYLVRGKYYEYHCRDCSRLAEYITICRVMGKTPNKVNNFMREYCETKKEYEFRKTEFDNVRLQENYKQHARAFDFEYGDFMVVLPTSAQDIIDEGINMHHCVGNYVDEVIKNDTYIVFVRHKNTPKQCYLTCQVSLNGTIQQYYLAYDKTIHSKEDNDFKIAFQNYLAANW